jgi:hypothetical protein
LVGERGGRIVVPALSCVTPIQFTVVRLQGMVEFVTFSRIFNTASPSAGVCPAGFKSVNVGNAGLQCLQLRVRDSA